MRRTAPNVWSAGTIVSIAEGGTNLTSYVTGDIPYASATNTLSRLGIGTTGSVLTAVSGVPTWAPQALIAGGPTYSIQYNNSGVLNGTSFFLYNTTVPSINFNDGVIALFSITSQPTFQLLQGGSGTSGTPKGGDININGGIPYTVNGSGGNINLTPGGKTGSGSIGNITAIVPTSNPGVLNAIWSNNGFLVQGNATFPAANIPVNAVYTSNSSLSTYTSGVSSGSINMPSTLGGDALFIPKIDVEILFFPGNNNQTITFYIERSVNGTFSDAVIISQRSYTMGNTSQTTQAMLTGIDCAATGNTGSTKTSTKTYRLRWSATFNFGVTTTGNWTASWLLGN